MKKQNINVTKTVNQAIKFVQSYPCCICGYEGNCGIKYIGTCKVATKLKIQFANLELLEDKGNE